MMRKSQGRCFLASVVVLAGMCLGGLPSAAIAASTRPFRRVVASTVTFASDGTRYVAWQVSQGAPVVALDTRRGSQQRFDTTAGCGLHDEELRGFGPPAAAGRFLLTCRNDSDLLNARTGAITALPVPTGRFDGGWDTVGSRYVRGTADPHDCRQSASEGRRGVLCIALYDIASGAISYRPESQLPDLDRAGAPPICASLRNRLIAEEKAGVLGRTLAYRAGYLARPIGRGGDVALERCNGRRTILHGAGEPENFDLRGGLLTWDTGHPGEQFQNGSEVSHGALWSYQPSTGRRRHWTLPRLRLIGENPVSGVLGYSTHTLNTVFWIATRTVVINEAGFTVGTSSIYAAKL
jgi:hypothetical protein